MKKNWTILLVVFAPLIIWGGGIITAETWNIRESDHIVYINNKKTDIQAFNINGQNYFKAVDIAKNFNIDVSFHEKQSIVKFDQNKPFTNVRILDENDKLVNEYIVDLDINKIEPNQYSIVESILLTKDCEIEYDLTYDGNGKIYVGFTKEAGETMPATAYFGQGNGKEGNKVYQTFKPNKIYFKEGEYQFFITNFGEEPIENIKGRVHIFY